MQQDTARVGAEQTCIHAGAACIDPARRAENGMKWTMTMPGEPRKRPIIPCRAAIVAAAAILSSAILPCAAFTDKEAREIFTILDSERDGKVTLVEFQVNKVSAFFWRSRNERGEIKNMTFEQTGLSREFFDKADIGHKGYLDGVDMTDAIRFEDVDVKKRGYFDYDDLVVFLKKIGK